MSLRSALFPHAVVVLALCAGGCEGRSLEAGAVASHGLLPVDERNPIVLTNDGATDTWQGEYAVLLASSGGPPLAGIVVGTSDGKPNLTTNLTGWQNLVTAARASGLQNLPDPIASASTALTRPTSGKIEDTQPHRSTGALFLLDASKRLSLPYRPLVVCTGGSLTDVADAYLIDPTVAERIVVVSALGTASESGGAMSFPNGQLDPWADLIVASRFRFVQVSAFYDQETDLPASQVSELPDNALGAWMAAKRASVYTITQAADQVSVIALGISEYVVTVERAAVEDSIDAGATTGPSVASNSNGNIWLVTKGAGALATARMWELLLDPHTFSH